MVKRPQCKVPTSGHKLNANHMREWFSMVFNGLQWVSLVCCRSLDWSFETVASSLCHRCCVCVCVCVSSVCFFFLIFFLEQQFVDFLHKRRMKRASYFVELLSIIESQTWCRKWTPYLVLVAFPFLFLQIIQIDIPVSSK